MFNETRRLFVCSTYQNFKKFQIHQGQGKLHKITDSIKFASYTFL